MCSMIGWFDHVWSFALFIALWVSMVTAENSVSIACHSPLCGDSTVELHHIEDADPGRAYFIEQRYLLSRIGYSDQIEFRKRETEHRHLEKLVERWSLQPYDFQHGSTVPTKLKTIVIRSSMLIPWPFHKHRHAIQGRSLGHVARIKDIFSVVCLIVVEGSKDMEQRPSVTALGMPIIFDERCHVDLRPLMTQYVGLIGEWSTLYEEADCCGLTQWQGNGSCVTAGSFLSFLEARIFYGRADLPDGHWMVSFRNVLNRCIAFSYEFGLANRVVVERAKDFSVVPTVLFGRTGQQEQRRGRLRKTQWLEAIFNARGSPETSISAITHRRGYVSLVQHVYRSLVEADSVVMFSRCASLSVSWDAATYGGLNVNIALAWDVDAAVGSYMRAMVSLPVLPFLTSIGCVGLKGGSRLRGCCPPPRCGSLCFLCRFLNFCVLETCPPSPPRFLSQFWCPAPKISINIKKINKQKNFFRKSRFSKEINRFGLGENLKKFGEF